MLLCFLLLLCQTLEDGQLNQSESICQEYLTRSAYVEYLIAKKSELEFVDNLCIHCTLLIQYHFQVFWMKPI